MIGYTILEKENVSAVFKNKPRWMACTILVLTVMAITTSAIAAGAVIGYTYCYLEYRHVMTTGNLTHSMNFQIVHMPYLSGTEKIKRNRNTTINSAISSILVSRILKIGHALLDEELLSMPWAAEVPRLVRRTE